MILWKKSEIKKKAKKSLISFSLFPLKIFGLVWLFKWLTNWNKIFSLKEVWVNILLFLSVTSLIISALVYGQMIMSSFLVVKGNGNQIIAINSDDDLNKLGTGIFFLFISTIVLIFTKVYFMKKRRREKYEKDMKKS